MIHTGPRAILEIERLPAEMRRSELINTGEPLQDIGGFETFGQTCPKQDFIRKADSKEQTVHDECELVTPRP